MTTTMTKEEGEWYPFFKELKDDLKSKQATHNKSLGPYKRQYLRTTNTYKKKRPLRIAQGQGDGESISKRNK